MKHLFWRSISGNVSYFVQFIVMFYNWLRTLIVRRNSACKYLTLMTECASNTTHIAASKIYGAVSQQTGNNWQVLEA